MPDKRNVDDLSIEELERVLAIKRREARLNQLRRMKTSGRVIDTDAPPEPIPPTTSTKRQAHKPIPYFEDDEANTYRKTKNDGNRIWRAFVNRSLLLVEIVAVLSLVGLGITMFDSIGELERETASAQSRADAEIRASIPTIAPTPQLRLAQLVLPGGHKPPSEGGGFNFDEIPEQYRSQVYDQIYLPVDTQRITLTDDTPRRLIIPQIDVDHVIVPGVDWEAMKNGVGMLPNGVTPKQDTGNVVLSAHNDIYGEIFRHLDQLEAGMQFQIQTGSQIFTYVITGIQQVEPDAVHVMDNQGRPTATLISCYPYRVNNMRIVVSADRVDV